MALCMYLCNLLMYYTHCVLGNQENAFLYVGTEITEQMFRIYEGSQHLSGVVQTHSNMFLVSCIKACLDAVECQQINYKQSEKQCQLLYSEILQPVSTEGWIFLAPM